MIMKKHGLILASVMIFGSFLSGCGSEPVDDAAFLEEVRESAPSAVAPAASPPVIELATPQFEMGLIPAVGFTFEEMPIYNRGESPLVIGNITTQCPCTTAKMKENTIPPGGEGTLVIKLDPDKVGGFRSTKRLTIASNDPRTPRVHLIVTAVVEGEVSLSEKQILFGVIEEGEAAEASIHLAQMHTTPLIIESIKLDGAPDFLTLDIDQLAEGEWGRPGIPEYSVTARISEESSSGRYNVIARVSIESGRRQMMNIPIKFTVKGIFGFEPGDVTVRNLAPGTNQEGVTLLTSRVPLKVTGVKSSNPNMTVTYAPGPEPNSYRFDLLVPERPENRLQKGELEVTMMVDGKEVVEVVRVVALLSRQ